MADKKKKPKPSYPDPEKKPEWQKKDPPQYYQRDPLERVTVKK